jgi:hypothetical protein
MKFRPPLLSALLPRVTAASLSSCLILLSLSTPCPAIEGLKVDPPYPLTPPTELFPSIDHWEYVRISPSTHFPRATIAGEFDIDREYNAFFDAAYHYRDFKHHIGVRKTNILCVDNVHQYHMYSSFHLMQDSLSLQYRESQWYGLEKSAYGFNSRLSKKGRGYRAEISSLFHHCDSLNDYTITSNYDRFYGYANMLSLEMTYHYSPYILDRKKAFLLIFRDRFAHKDFLFLTPGIKAEFLSQTYFTPFVDICFLVTRNLSLSLFAESPALNNRVVKPYERAFLVRNDSLISPSNTYFASLEAEATIDTAFIISAKADVRKTKDPVVLLNHERNFLRQDNLDTTIVFYETQLNVRITKNFFDIVSSLKTSHTPFYEGTLPYSPDFEYKFCLRIKPLSRIAISGELRGIASIISDQQEAFHAQHLFSMSLALSPSRHLSINISGINIADSRGRILNTVHLPGRIITSGITIIF